MPYRRTYKATLDAKRHRITRRCFPKYSSIKHKTLRIGNNSSQMVNIPESTVAGIHTCIYLRPGSSPTTALRVYGLKRFAPPPERRLLTSTFQPTSYARHLRGTHEYLVPTVVHMNTRYLVHSIPCGLSCVTGEVRLERQRKILTAVR